MRQITGDSIHKTIERRKVGNALLEKVLGGMLHVVIREGRHREVAVVVVGLVADLDALDTGLLGGLLQVLGEELALLVEVVASSLVVSVQFLVWEHNEKGELTTSMSTSSGPFHFLMSSVASCSFHFCWSSPRYPENAFWPQGQLMGLEMGAKADTDLYLPGLRRNCSGDG